MQSIRRVHGPPHPSIHHCQQGCLGVAFSICEMSVARSIVSNASEPVACCCLVRLAAWFPPHPDNNTHDSQSSSGAYARRMSDLRPIWLHWRSPTMGKPDGKPPIPIRCWPWARDEHTNSARRQPLSRGASGNFARPAHPRVLAAPWRRRLMTGGIMAVLRRPSHHPSGAPVSCLTQFLGNNLAMPCRPRWMWALIPRCCPDGILFTFRSRPSSGAA